VADGPICNRGYAAEPGHVVNQCEGPDQRFGRNKKFGQRLDRTTVELPAYFRALFDALADVLAACVHSSGPSGAFPTDCSSITSASPPCDQLLCYTKATNTLGAAINEALNPTVVSPLSHKSLPFNLVTSGSPFQPIPASTPNDLTLGLNYVTPAATNGIAIDAAGNAWVVSNGLLEFGPSGALLSPATGFSGGGLNMTSASNAPRSTRWGMSG
jgi:hypothetical protein